MTGIYHVFTIKAPLTEVFNSISTPRGLNSWWTEKSEGKAIVGTIYLLNFGEPYQWEAVVTKSTVNNAFELQMTKTDEEWMETKIGFILSLKDNSTKVSFYHTGWRNMSENFMVSNYCWAMYFRILKRGIEHGEQVPYQNRLSV